MSLSIESSKEILKFLLPYAQRCDNECDGCLMQDQGELCLIGLMEIRLEGK